MIKVAIGSQGSTFELKEKVKEYLVKKGYDVCDMGQTDPKDSDFPLNKTAEGIASKILSGECARGIIMCGCGAGASIISNKIRGIYCVACESTYMASKIYPKNQANVLAMGEITVTAQMACEMALAYLESDTTDDDLGIMRAEEEKYFK